MDDQQLKIVKAGVRLIVMSGTSKIVRDIVSLNTDPETLIDKIRVTGGAIAIGGLLADAVGEHTDRKVDEALVGLQKLKKLFQGDTPTDI